MKKIFVGNLAWEADEEALRPLFESYGKVVKINVVQDQATGRSRGFGFVEMESADAASQAIAGLNDKPVLGRNLRVSLAQERQERSDRGGSGSSGSRGGREGGGGRGGDREYRGGNGGGGGNFGSRPFRSRSEGNYQE
ncbi:MAG: RNA-binding protein [Parachlamydiaceae bacterium]|nr:RNA-binding protein [Parachlamydiaceae bacterium]